MRSFVPDLAAIARLGPVGLVVTGQEAEGAKADFVSRYFAPGAGIPEDPVTGSIHATLVPIGLAGWAATSSWPIRRRHAADGSTAN
ncbi:PhzF family phenazine biosynthesis protein [Mesorhizobium sp.]|uniref:PhzF family phenazine biosynthesis protein n=1 Tax=Mesorhizobium sp. TaxID=1871066 RepID=UPI00342B62E1